VEPLSTRLALKLMALTFVRTSELIGEQWSEFDIEAARWNIPAERMKMRTPHIVPLSRPETSLKESTEKCGILPCRPHFRMRQLPLPMKTLKATTLRLATPRQSPERGPAPAHNAVSAVNDALATSCFNR
jgi:integrase